MAIAGVEDLPFDPSWLGKLNLDEGRGEFISSDHLGMEPCDFRTGETKGEVESFHFGVLGTASKGTLYADQVLAAGNIVVAFSVWPVDGASSAPHEEERRRNQDRL